MQFNGWNLSGMSWLLALTTQFAHLQYFDSIRWPTDANGRSFGVGLFGVEHIGIEESFHAYEGDRPDQ